MKKFYLPIILFLVANSTLFAQGIPLPPTKSFKITGDIKSPITINDIDLEKFAVHPISNLKITNHKGEIKREIAQLDGVLLTDILKAIELTTDNVKLFSEYYFVCQASDGYKVVYSWNEIFNTTIGNSVYLIVSKEGKKMTEDQENILMISTNDTHTGRRYIKNLTSILVKRAE